MRTRRLCVGVCTGSLTAWNHSTTMVLMMNTGMTSDNFETLLVLAELELLQAGLSLAVEVL